MIYIGEYQRLSINRETPQGFYLGDQEGNEVLLPGSYRQGDMSIGQTMEVFVYTDSENRPIATTQRPLLTLNTAATLLVTDVNKVGAFCAWGVSKELFVPFRNQKQALQKGQKAVVYMYLDEQSNRLVGTTNFKKYYQEQNDGWLEKGQAVDILVAEQSELGFLVIINHTYLGLVYHNEAEDLAIGESRKGYIKPLREDGKIDVSLHAVGAASIEPNAQMLLDRLAANDGFLPYHDGSDPELIRLGLGISKKLFKKAVGALYRQKLIVLEKDGIRLA